VTRTPSRFPVPGCRGRLRFRTVPSRVAANQVAAGAAWTLLLDAAAAECIATLRAEDIRAILLKGPVTAHWLYSGHAPRAYADVDLLVARDQFPRAIRTLKGIGYRNVVEARDTVEGAHAVPLSLERSYVAGRIRLPAGLLVDLHWTFHGIGASDELLWTVVAGNAEQMLVSGTEVDVPSEPARALFLALHATTAVQDSVRQPLADLDRALEQLPDDTWRAARQLAVRFDALPRFAVGLAMRPLGLDLIDRLHLKGTVDMRAAVHSAGAPPPVADGLVRLRDTRGIRPRVRLLARALIPTRPSLRLTHPRLARLGTPGLALAYTYRPVWLLAKLPAALRAYARARRMVQADDLCHPGDNGSQALDPQRQHEG
jgi:Uncharacterised nucleotidyltransferase